MIVALALALGVFGARSLAAQTGVVTGVVVGATTSQPLLEAAVNLEGTTLQQVTNASGRYILQNVPVGVYTLAARLIGYAPLEKSVTVTPGRTVTVDLSLATTAVTLGELVPVGDNAGDAT